MNMKKICLLFAIFCSFFGFLSVNSALAEVDTATFFVFADFASVYENASLHSEKIAILAHKHEVEIELTSNEPTEFLEGDCVFYKIQNSGYILAELVSKKTKTLTSTPNFNAKTNTECNAFISNNGIFEKTSTTLAKGTQIFLYEGYDSKKEFTAIAYVKDNEVLYGYLETKNIKPNGINPTIIIVFSLVAAILGIALAFVFIKGNKKKKMS